MRWFWLLLGFGLTACADPSLYFRGAEVTRVTVDGSVFDVRVRGDLAEAVRVNPAYAPRLGPIGPRAGRAMAQVSGCRVRGILGDQAQITGVLECSDRREALPSATLGSVSSASGAGSCRP